MGLLVEGFELCTEEVVQRVVRQAAERLTEAGCIVKEISVPMHKDGKREREQGGGGGGGVEVWRDGGLEEGWRGGGV